MIVVVLSHFTDVSWRAITGSGLTGGGREVCGEKERRMRKKERDMRSRRVKTTHMTRWTGSGDTEQDLKRATSLDLRRGFQRIGQNERQWTLDMVS